MVGLASWEKLRSMVQCDTDENAELAQFGSLDLGG